MNEFFTWEFLGTFAGCALAAGIMTQLLKGAVDSLVKLPTQLLAYILALVVLVAAQGFTGQLTLDSAVLCLPNAVLIALAASGGYDAVTRITGQ